MSNSKLIVSHPGVYIKDAIDALNMTQSEFAARIGMTGKNLSTIISGDSRITLEVAEKLSSFFHSSVDMWINLQNAYDLYLKEEEKEEEEKENWEIVKMFDRRFLSKICDVEYNIKNKKEIISELEDLFMVGSLRNLRNKEMFAFYKTAISGSSDEKETILRNAWISLAMKKANEMECGEYDSKKLKDSLSSIRKMTTMKPHEFTPLLKKTLSDAGVKYVELPYLKGSNIRGVTKWLINDNNVMVAVNDCDHAADRIWFTIFHELGHVIDYHKRHFVISYDGDQSAEEMNADEFARDCLIDRNEYEKFVAKRQFDYTSIKEFAEKEEIADFIVIGRLEDDGLIPKSKYKIMKTGYAV